METKCQLVCLSVRAVEEPKIVEAPPLGTGLLHRDHDLAYGRSGIGARGHNPESVGRLQSIRYAPHRPNKVRIRVRATGLGIVRCANSDTV